MEVASKGFRALKEVQDEGGNDEAGIKQESMVALPNRHFCNKEGSRFHSLWQHYSNPPASVHEREDTRIDRLCAKKKEKRSKRGN